MFADDPFLFLNFYSETGTLHLPLPKPLDAYPFDAPEVKKACLHEPKSRRGGRRSQGCPVWLRDTAGRIAVKLFSQKNLLIVLEQWQGNPGTADLCVGLKKVRAKRISFRGHRAHKILGVVVCSERQPKWLDSLSVSWY
jgi:hypothetical protein